VVDLVASCTSGDECSPPPPARTLGGEGSEEAPQLVVTGRWRVEALGGARLADDPAGPALSDPELGLEQPNCCSTTVRG